MHQHIKGLLQVLILPCLIQLPANVPVKTAEDASITWTHTGDWSGAPGTCLQPGPPLVSLAIWGANHQTEGVFVSHCFCLNLFVSLFTSVSLYLSKYIYISQFNKIPL